MKFVHLSDLHLGKRLNEYSLIEEQKHILNQILNALDDIKADAVIIAGDVYDKSVPSTDAVNLLDEFLYDICQKSLPIYLIGGNHDSQERLSFGGRLLGKNKLYISPIYNGELQKFTLDDQYGKLNIYLLPFIKPSQVKRVFKEQEINSYTDAVNSVLKRENIDFTTRNVLVTHQFVTGAKTCDSEEISVGGTDNVDASVFNGFDYVALGHIHSPQNVKENVRYCGTPLKYSFSETHEKSITVVDVKEKNDVTISTIPLRPLRDLIIKRGKFSEVAKSELFTENYVKVILTDEDDVIDASNKLREFYPNLMKLEYDNTRTRQSAALETIKDIENKSPIELFSEFYTNQNNTELSHEQNEFLLDLIQKIWEEQ